MSLVSTVSKRQSVTMGVELCKYLTRDTMGCLAPKWLLLKGWRIAHSWSGLGSCAHIVRENKNSLNHITYHQNIIMLLLIKKKKKGEREKETLTL